MRGTTYSLRPLFALLRGSDERFALLFSVAVKSVTAASSRTTELTDKFQESLSVGLQLAISYSWATQQRSRISGTIPCHHPQCFVAEDNVGRHTMLACQTQSQGLQALEKTLLGSVVRRSTFHKLATIAICSFALE